MAPFLRKLWSLAAVVLWLGSLAGCGEKDPRFTQQRSLLPTPVGVGKKLLLVERSGASAFLVDAQSADTAPMRVPVLPDPTRVVARRAHGDQALVLSAGVSGDRNALQSPGGLTLVRSDGTTRTFVLGNDPFDFLTQQPAGRYVALLRTGVGDQLLQNANEMALVDLDSEAADDDASSARLVTLPEAPRAVFFSEEFSLNGEAHPLAVAVTENMAAVFDLDKADALPVLIQLNTDPEFSLFPQEVRFDPLNERFYIRSSGTDDIFSLRLVTRAPAERRASFGISLDIVAAGPRPTDMQLFEDAGTNRLLVMASGNSSAVVVDVATSRTTAVRLANSYDHALVYYTGDGAERVPRALLWGELGGALATLALNGSSTIELDQSLVVLPALPSGVLQTVPFADGTVAFIGRGLHLTLVDPVRGSVTPYNSREAIADGLLDAQRALLWLAPRGQSRVAHLDLSNGSTDEMLLDDAVMFATLVPDASRLAVVHDEALGHVTFVNLDDPSRSSSIGVRGFLVDGWFE